MYKINTYNLLYDFKDFIKENKGKFFIILIVNLIGVVFGVRSGLSVYNAESYLLSNTTNDFLLLIHERGIFAHFFINLISCIVIFTIIALSSAHFLICYCCLPVLLFRAYSIAMDICLYVFIFKLSVLPFIIVFIIPYFVASSCIYAIVTIMALNRAREIRLYGCGCGNTFPIFVQKLIFPCIMLAILLIILEIPAHFLTIGIIL